MPANVQSDREVLSAAAERGALSQLGAFLKLSGPGWLQSAITLGGGSLGSALYLGVLGGNSMLWLQLIAIIIGVVMLSAISYVTLSTGKRPYQAINEYINPVLGVGWITATILANMIWILPQFSLCFDTLDNNLLPGVVNNSQQTKIIVSAIIGAITLSVVVMSFNRGLMSRLFDVILKLIVGLIIVCFVAAVVYLSQQDQIKWGEVGLGFLPNLFQWSNPAPDIQQLMSGLSDQWRTFWHDEIMGNQRRVMISTTATVVGINMTFLLPYSMIARGWDKPFRGLARFDLITGMAIPFILVTSCIVMSSAYSFHAKADAAFLSDDPAEVASSPLFGGALGILEERFMQDPDNSRIRDVAAMPQSTPEEQAAKSERRKALIAELAAQLPQEERKLAATLVKPNTGQLAKSLSPLLGDKNANLVFGLGAFAMGFSTIIILMLINGYALAEILGRYDSRWARTIGALLAGVTGFCWVWIWTGTSQTWLIIVASTFGAILLPIAYLSFFLLMNSRSLLGDEKPVGRRMIVWNVLMAIGLLGAAAQAYLATGLQIERPGTGSFVVGGVVTFLLLALIGFSARIRKLAATNTEN